VFPAFAFVPRRTSPYRSTLPLPPLSETALLIRATEGPFRSGRCSAHTIGESDFHRRIGVVGRRLVMGTTSTVGATAVGATAMETTAVKATVEVVEAGASAEE
jgi:hypothetical protein